MQEQHTTIQTADGAMNTFITCPEEGGPYPAVIFYMDAPGKREELHDMARRIATVGYYVVLPNLYYRDVSEFHLGMPDATRERMRELMDNLSNAVVCEDTRAILAFLEGEKLASDGPVGAVGYCMSGPYALAAAARYPERVAAAASFYGTWLVSDAVESPHLNFQKIQGELYIACAEHDELAPMAMVEQLKTAFSQSGADGEIEIYPKVQ